MQNICKTITITHRIFYQNVRGLNTKLSNLYLKRFGLEYDIVAMTETWLNSSVQNSEIFCSNYNLFRKDREGRIGGGVLIAVKFTYHSEFVSNELFEDIEFVCVKIGLPGNNRLFISCSYIPPNSNMDVYNKHSTAIHEISQLLDSSDYLVVLGDFNLPNINWIIDDNSWRCSPSTSTNNFLDELFGLSLSQINKIMNNNNRLLDLVFVNDNTFSSVARALPLTLPEDLHHPSLDLSFETCIKKSSCSRSSRIHCFKKADWNKLRSLLSSVNWDSVFVNSDINNYVALFYGILWSCIDQCVPITEVKEHTINRWETPRLKYLKNLKNRLFKKFKRLGTLMSYAQYAEARYRYFKCNKECYVKRVKRLEKK